MTHTISNREGGRDGRRIYDRRRVERLRTSLGSAAIVDELIDLFISELPQQVAAVCEAASNGDAAGLAFAAHRLRSGSGNFGTRRLDAVCEHIEELGRAGALVEAAAMLQRLRDEAELVTVALRAERVADRKTS